MKMSRNISLTSACITLLPFLSQSLSFTLMSVFPFYVIETEDELSWSKSDIGLLFSFWSFGGLIGAQILPITTAIEKRNTADNKASDILFIGHFIQIMLGCIGFLLTSGIFKWNYWLFCASMMLIGMSASSANNQIYVKKIGGSDIKQQEKLMSNFATCKLLSKFICNTIGPVLYDNFDYEIFSIFTLGCGVLYILCVAIIMYEIEMKRKKALITSAVNSSDKKQEMNIADVNADTDPFVNIATKKLLSSSLVIVLITLSILISVRFWFQLSTSILFVTKFGLSASIAAYLSMAGGIISIFMTKFNFYLHGKYIKFEYPYDFLLYLLLFVVSCLAFAILPSEIWVAILFYPLGKSAPKICESVEMCSRLYLCPTFLFRKVTGYMQILAAVTSLLFGLVTVLLLNVSDIFPLIITIAVLLIMTIVIIMAYLLRRKKLSDMFIGDKFREMLKVSYLMSERYYFAFIQKTAHRRKDITNIEKEETVMNEALDSYKNIKQILNQRGSMYMILAGIPPVKVESQEYSDISSDLDTGSGIVEVDENGNTDSDDDENGTTDSDDDDADKQDHSLLPSH